MAVAAYGQLDLTEYSKGARSIERYEKLEQIGEGTYSQVYRARDRLTNEIVALKKFRPDTTTEGFPRSAIREVRILKRLDHENVIKLKETVTSPGPERDRPDGNKYRGGIYLVFEYMDHDLAGLTDQSELVLTPPQIKCYMKQLLKGLHYCHLKEIIHRDIKGANLLINNEGILKIADFGLAKSITSICSKRELTSHVITLWYRPPELLLGATNYGPAVDIWSAGCIFAELLNRKYIFRGRTEVENLHQIFELCGTPNERNWPGVSKLPLYDKLKPLRPMRRRLREVYKHFGKPATKLLERMLTLDPAQRISAEDALNADYFWTDPLPSDPKSLPKYEPSHLYQTKKKRQQEGSRPRMILPPKKHYTRLLYGSGSTSYGGGGSGSGYGSGAWSPSSPLGHGSRDMPISSSHGGAPNHPRGHGSFRGSHDRGRGRSGSGYGGRTLSYPPGGSSGYNERKNQK